MPEGDTIHRWARALGRALTGAEVTAASSRVPGLAPVIGRLVGQAVGEVESRGKHLLMWFTPSDVALHTHMRMTGSWHLYPPGVPWRKPSRLARVSVEVPGWTAVCFSAPVCELWTRDQADRCLAHLGPDALGVDVDLGEARGRLDVRADRTVAEALLDQAVLAGLGNVYVCEVLFAHGVHPWTAVRDVSPETRDALLATASRLLRANAEADAGIRTTTGRPGTVPRGRHLAVYGRGRKPCLRCRTPVRVRRGPHGRLSYWCPRCQPPV